jgi:uncharacterized membrane protein
MLATSAPLVAVELLTASIWVGGMVCIAIVAKSARDALDESSQVALFRSVGRRYGIVGTASLLIAIAAGLGLAWPPPSWSRIICAAVILAGILVVATVIGMMQARAMTALRRKVIANPKDNSAADALRRCRLLANGIRGLMALVTLAIVLLAAIALAQ